MWPCPSVYLKCIQRKRFYVALVFSTAHPAYGAQRSERVAFLGRIRMIFPALVTGEKGGH